MWLGPVPVVGYGAAVLEDVLIDTHVLELHHSPPAHWVRLGSAGWDEGTVILMRCGDCNLHAWPCSRERPMVGHAPTPVLAPARSCSADPVLDPYRSAFGAVPDFPAASRTCHLQALLALLHLQAVLGAFAVLLWLPPPVCGVSLCWDLFLLKWWALPGWELGIIAQNQKDVFSLTCFPAINQGE